MAEAEWKLPSGSTRSSCRPLTGEFADYAKPDIDAVPGDDAVAALEALATVALLAGLPAEAWQRRGIVNGYTASVWGLAFHIAGHELHHLRVLREKYL